MILGQTLYTICMFWYKFLWQQIFPGKNMVKLLSIKCFARKICPKLAQTKQSQNKVN